jgi:hypothetical protein
MAPEAAFWTWPSKRCVRLFPPKTKAMTMITRTRVRGRAIIGEDSQSNTSSIAATPSNMKAQVGIEDE